MLMTVHQKVPFLGIFQVMKCLLLRFSHGSGEGRGSEDFPCLDDGGGGSGMPSSHGSLGRS